MEHEFREFLPYLCYFFCKVNIEPSSVDVDIDNVLTTTTDIKAVFNQIFQAEGDVGILYVYLLLNDGTKKEITSEENLTFAMPEGTLESSYQGKKAFYLESQICSEMMLYILQLFCLNFTKSMLSMVHPHIFDIRFVLCVQNRCLTCV